MPGAVVLDGHPLLDERQVDAADEVPRFVAHRVLRGGMQPCESEGNADAALRL
jgi:hypothetical protein